MVSKKFILLGGIAVMGASSFSAQAMMKRGLEEGDLPETKKSKNAPSSDPAPQAPNGLHKLQRTRSIDPHQSSAVEEPPPVGLTCNGAEKKNRLTQLKHQREELTREMNQLQEDPKTQKMALEHLEGKHSQIEDALDPQKSMVIARKKTLKAENRPTEGDELYENLTKTYNSLLKLHVLLSGSIATRKEKERLQQQLDIIRAELQKLGPPAAEESLTDTDEASELPH
jgi:hypothetical protein